MLASSLLGEQSTVAGEGQQTGLRNLTGVGYGHAFATVRNISDDGFSSSEEARTSAHLQDLPILASPAREPHHPIFSTCRPGCVYNPASSIPAALFNIPCLMLWWTRGAVMVRPQGTSPRGISDAWGGVGVLAVAAARAIGCGQ